MGYRTGEGILSSFGSATLVGKAKFVAGLVGIAVATPAAVAISLACVPVGLPLAWLLSRGPATSAPVGLWLPALPVLGMMAAPALWESGWEKLSKQLVKAGVDGQAAKLQGNMSKEDLALFEALGREDNPATEVEVKGLLESGANPNATRWRNILGEPRSESALLLATSNSNVGACKALLEAGADVKVKSHAGWGLLAQCMTNEYWIKDGKSKKEIYETVDLLVDHGAPTSNEYFHESMAEHHHGSNFLKNRITKRAASFSGVAAKGADAELLLMKAVQEVNSDLALVALAKGARLDSEAFEELAKKQGEGWTALRWAAAHANAAMVSTLLSAGANPNECAEGFDSPLGICMKKAKASSEARLAASMLCKAGSDPEAILEGGASAARRARELGYTNWAAEMIEGFEDFKSKPSKKMAP